MKNLNLLGPICTSGYGVVACELLVALSRQVRVALFPIGPVDCPAAYDGVYRAGIQNSQSYDRTAPSLRIFHQWILGEHVGKGTHAAFPIFELDTLNDAERCHLNNQDLVFVASKWAENVLKINGVRPPVEVVPLGVNAEVFYPRPMPESATTTFLHVGKLEYRKGAYDILEAFARAFEPDDDVRLIFHVHNPFLAHDKAVALYQEFQGLCSRHRLADRIALTNGRLRTQQEVADLMAQADCGLFPARAEGWNLELAEMLAMGRHCIATNFSGHTEFVNNGVCRLINIDRTETAYDGVYFFGGGQWAHLGPMQIEQLVGHMRAIHEQKQAGELTLNEAGVRRMLGFSWEAAAEKIAAVLGVSCG